MPNVGSQIEICDLPVRFDTYVGCTHRCQYCFATRKNKKMQEVRINETHKGLAAFISGKRDYRLGWCDWDIPIHWGGMSDPFQPVEEKFRESYKCLELLKETQYPFVVSTKGKLIGEEEYLNIIKDCNCVVQISLVCPEFNKIEKGAPTFEERIEIIRRLAKHKRVNVRIQPYMIEFHKSIMLSLDKFAEAGASGVILEGMKHTKKVDGTIRLGADYVYPVKELKPRFEQIKEKAHSLGMKFYSGENRLRAMGDNLCCCGIDGVEGFKGNSFNANHFVHGGDCICTKAMEGEGTGACFTSLYQSTGIYQVIKKKSFKEMMSRRYLENKKYYWKILTDKYE